MVRCCIISCNSDSEKKIPGISFHAFPDDPDLRQKWILTTGRKNWTPTKYSKICSNHFPENVLIKKKKKTVLYPDAVPTAIKVVQSGEKLSHSETSIQGPGKFNKVQNEKKKKSVCKMSYGAQHRFFLRTVASQGVITYSNSQNILNEAFPDGERKPIEELVKEINDKIRPFQQTIKIVIDEVTSEKNIVFLSLGFDDATKSQNVFSPHELDFFRILIEHIMTTESRQITSQYALNLVNQLSNKRLTKTDAQKLLKTWCRMHYLEEINLNYALGIRAIHEFQHYLRENMPDTIQECCLCKEIVFRGYNCPPCGEAIHLRCLNEYLQRIKKWPCCKADFHENQLEMLNGGGLSQTQHLEESQRTTQRMTQRLSSTIEETLGSSDDDFEQTQSTPIPGVSQRISRKRKRSSRH